MNTYQKQPAQRRRRIRRKYMIRRIVAVVIMVAMLATVIWLCSLVVRAICGSADKGSETPAAATLTTDKQTPGAVLGTATAGSEDATDGTQEPAPFFELTAEERELIEQVVSAESCGEPYDGQRAVAQCILTACLKDGIRPAEAITKYKYTKARVEPTASVKRAVAAVFDDGDLVTEEPILYFYNPDIGDGTFHETQVHVMTIKNHKFFKEAE